MVTPEPVAWIKSSSIENLLGVGSRYSGTDPKCSSSEITSFCNKIRITPNNALDGDRNLLCANAHFKNGNAKIFKDGAKSPGTARVTATRQSHKVQNAFSASD